MSHHPLAAMLSALLATAGGLLALQTLPGVGPILSLSGLGTLIGGAVLLGRHHRGLHDEHDRDLPIKYAVLFGTLGGVYDLAHLLISVLT